MKHAYATLVLAALMIPALAAPSYADWDDHPPYGGPWGYHRNHFGWGDDHFSLSFNFGPSPYYRPAPPPPVYSYYVAPPMPVYRREVQTYAYYCPYPRGYYPYIQQCFRPWQAQWTP